MDKKLSFEEAERRIDEIAEELTHENPGSKSEKIIELQRLCGHHHTFPKSYGLGDVVKEGDRAQRITEVTELWKGRYNDEVVALKILRVPREDPRAQKAKSRFCKEIVLMKQIEHDNILPFYGVSTSVSDLCMVFPWCENGNVMDYLKTRPDTNRFGLLSGAADGLRSLHDNRLVHGALRPSQILIDDNGTASQLDYGHIRHADIENYRYSAPEIQWPEEHGMDEILITKESDVYGMAMVVYEVLTGNAPYSECNDIIALAKIQGGEIPQRPPSGTADSIWELLEECWSRDPIRRPPIAHVLNVLSNPRALPQEGRPAVGELPGKLKLQVRSIKISLNKSRQQKFSVKFKYGNRDHTTSATKAVAGDEHKWNVSETWLIETNKQNQGQPVTVEVFRISRFRREDVCATGKLSLLNNVNKRVHVDLDAPGSTGPAVLEIFVMEMF